MRYKKSILLIAFTASLLVYTKPYAQQPGALIQAGNLSDAEAQLLNQPDSYHKLKLLGDIYFDKGYLERALQNWKKSNELRVKQYGKDDYHTAWNYALLSKYYREKINPAIAIAYADSCLYKIQNLNNDQYLEIEVWKLWNIIGQGYKQKRLTVDFKNHAEIYDDVRSLYQKSVAFIKKNGLPKIHLARAFHLIGNTHTDQTSEFKHHKNDEESLKHYNLANDAYDKAISITQSIYGENHPQIALSYLTKGLLNIYVSKDVVSESGSLIINNFEKSLKAYGYTFTNSSLNIKPSEISHEVDFLMVSQHLMRYYFLDYNTTKDESERLVLLEKLDLLSVYSMKIWQNYYEESAQVNANLNLSIYNLLPFTSKLSVEVLKNRLGQPYTPDSLFYWVQKHKSYDVVNAAKITNKTVSSQDIQASTTEKEVFVDYII